MEVSDAKRLREFEAELDKAALKELVEGKWQRPRSDAGPLNAAPAAWWGSPGRPPEMLNLPHSPMLECRGTVNTDCPSSAFARLQ